MKMNEHTLTVDEMPMHECIRPKDYEEKIKAKYRCKVFFTEADVVEVVRCKDCKHQKNDTKYCRTHNKYYCELDDAIKERNHYCSYGERRSKK